MLNAFFCNFATKSMKQKNHLICFTSTFPTADKGVHALVGKLALCSARTQRLKGLTNSCFTPRCKRNLFKSNNNNSFAYASLLRQKRLVNKVCKITARFTPSVTTVSCQLPR